MYERNVSQIEALVRRQNEWRAGTLNLIASENVLSERARGVMGSDFAHRYAEGHPGERYYQGTEIIDEVEARLKKHLKTLFRCRQVDVRPVSGTVANDAVFRQIGGKRYFLTGDIGHLDEDGFLVITDRKKDLILVGGFNVYPREVEELLFTHPKVAEAAVIGVPDPHTGEAVKAFVKLKEGVSATEQEILDYCKENMAGYKRPRSVEFRESFPTSVIGKVLRRVLRDEILSGKTVGDSPSEIDRKAGA